MARKVIFILVALALSAPALYAAERGVAMELFTATWCGYCPYANYALNRIYDEQGPDKWAPVAWHASSSGMWYTVDAEARKGYYGVTAYPWAWCDGSISHRGAYTSNEEMYTWYMSSFNIRRAAASPLTIEFVHFSYGEGKASVMVNLTLEEALAAGHACHFVLWEDNLSYGGHDYRFVSRKLETKDVTVSAANESEEIGVTFTLDGAWKTADLGISVFVQDPTTKEIKQARAKMLEEGVSVVPTSLGKVKTLFR
ncbi:MAG: hypothetical protein PVH29_06960 [Candidatus Zixiibacteriota bacterium]|jgi:hypothetical protein